MLLLFHESHRLGNRRPVSRPQNIAFVFGRKQKYALRLFNCSGHSIPIFWCNARNAHMSGLPALLLLRLLSISLSSAATNSQPQRYASHRGVWIGSRTETTHDDFGNRWTEDADWITAVTWARPTQSVPPPAKVCLNSIDANMSCHLTHTILHACPLKSYYILSFC